MRVFTSALRRNTGNSSFQNFQKRLLYTFTGYITGDGRIFRFTGDLVDLVDINDPSLSALNIKISILDQFQQDILDVLTYITGFCQSSSVSYCKGHLQDPGQRLRQQSFTAAGRPQHQNV